MNFDPLTEFYIRRSRQNWWLYEFALPVVALLLMVPACIPFVSSSSQEGVLQAGILRCMAPGELLLVSSVLSFGLYNEAKTINELVNGFRFRSDSGEVRDLPAAGEALPFVSGIAFFLFFAVARLYTVTYPPEHNSNEWHWVMAVFSIVSPVLVWRLGHVVELDLECCLVGLRRFVIKYTPPSLGGNSSVD